MTAGRPIDIPPCGCSADLCPPIKPKENEMTQPTEYPGVEDQTTYEWPDLPDLTEDEYRNGVTEIRTQKPTPQDPA